MKIELRKIKIRDLVVGYANDEESGQVIAYNGRLNIRPKYQREFVYKEAQRDAVIQTVMKGFPLNTMYWVRNTDKDAEFEFEVLDGQQRTISICKYYHKPIAIDFEGRKLGFLNLMPDKKEQFLDYELQIYICEGEYSEKLDWFRVINIAGEKLSEQELRNAIYPSKWLSDAKVKFSKKNNLAEQRGGKYLKGSSIRQEFLETAIAWIVDSRKGEKICEYMAKNASSAKNADELWQYFCAVIDWVEMKFIKYRKEMKGLEWGSFYNEYKDLELDAKELESEISRLMQDSEVQKKSGIYEYILSGNEKHLNLRAFEDNIKREVYEEQKGLCANKKCPNADKKFELDEMEADHIKPWSKGGKTIKENCQLLCVDCNRTKSAR